MNKDIEAVIAKHPKLTDHGFGVMNEHRISEEERKQVFANDQADLLKNTESFEKACEWLSKYNKGSGINETCTSYGLKHIAEKELGHYFTNGVLIAAAVHCGFEVVRVDNSSPNAYLNISQESLEKMAA